MPARGKVVKIASPFIILLVAVAIFAGLFQSRPTKPAVSKKETVWRVAVTQVDPRPRRPMLPLYGRIETPRSSKLRAAITADVQEVKVEEGDLVRRGQLLVQLDEQEVKLEWMQRQADLKEIEAFIASEKVRHTHDLKALKHEKSLLALSRRAVERAEILEQRKLTPRSVLDEAQQAAGRQALELNNRLLAIDDHQARLAQLKARQLRAQALLDQAKLDLERTRITSPYTGRIASVAIAAGDRVQSGDELLEIYDTDALEVRAQIPSSYAGQIRKALAQNVPLRAAAKVDGSALLFSLDRLAGRVERGSGGVDALLKLKKPEHAALPLGNFVELRLQLPLAEDVVMLPFEAIYGLDRVYKLVGGRMQAVAVERIGEYPDKEGQIQVLVKSPQLGENDQVITTQLPNAMEGLRVEVVADS
ncbi:efflux RND transporter periplasmic adaptor subunit [Nitrosococcus watsonii]|uniref:Efflux transporter, RND family, MFP subunit n=1 Tax=Nitrosococcus watsoni (strain C-113) TaxID=105559 RepID=D8KC05_NITWC|nr:HlyD family efflux transporter periplasmic adaptor subunit [Nitrosococcus watsonii]ADJ29676.1 efflux transporter, RND family, MFP subunit [Nitrosococcus watsonii C-113]